MSESVYCGGCGGEIASTAKFCKHCGADQSPFREVKDAPSYTPVAPPKEPQPRSGFEEAGERAEQVAPGATELAERLAAGLRAPGVSMAGVAALVGVAICLVAGLAVAVIFPRSSFISLGGSGLFDETMLQAVAFSQANLELAASGATLRTTPILLVLVPVMGVAVGAALASSRAEHMPARERLLWGAATGLPFALLMLVIAVSVGRVYYDFYGDDIRASAGAVFLLSLLWGSLGGTLGVAYALRREGQPLHSPVQIPPQAARLAGIAWTVLRPLALALALAAVLGALLWAPWAAIDSDYRGAPQRSAPVAAIEQVAYAGERAVDLVALGTGAQLRLGAYPALPIDPARGGDLVGEKATGDSAPTYSVFGFADAMPAILFVLALVVLVAIPALLALYAGFSVARRVGETRVERAAAWGAVVGPLWAVAMVMVASVVRKGVVGDPSGDSVFLTCLVGGALLGALGAVLAFQSSSQAPPTPPTTHPRGRAGAGAVR